MATASEAKSVKSLNTGPGRRRFVYESTKQRIEKVDIDVYQRLEISKAEPSEGSTFFRDCLMEWRELNTAEDFITFYEEMLPLVQTLPQIILHKKLILTQLLSRLHIKGRLSVEPILRLIAELSKDLLEDFSPFLGEVADSILNLLESGADREPDIIEQIFTSWSSIMMYMQKYLVCDIAHVLRDTVKLRYYRKDYIQDLMAESLSILLRTAPCEPKQEHDQNKKKQIEKGVRIIMKEVAKKPLDRKSGASALFLYSMRGSSSKLHSKAERLLLLLVDESIFGIGDKYGQGNCIVEVVIETFQWLCEELEPKDLSLMWKCLFDEINEAVLSRPLLHLSRLLSLLISTLQLKYFWKFSDHQLIVKLLQLLMQQFILAPNLLIDENFSEVVDMSLQLILCILNGLHKVGNISGLNVVCEHCSSVLSLRNSSLLPFIKELLLKDYYIVNRFRHEIISALGDFIGTSEEEVVSLLIKYGGKLLDNDKNVKEGSKISNHLQSSLKNWIGVINQIAIGNPSHIEETKLALLWGIIGCCSHMSNTLLCPKLLLDLVDALDQLHASNSGIMWQSLIGAALRSYKNMFSTEQITVQMVGKFLLLVKRYVSSPHILSAVADIFDHMDPALLYGELEAEMETTFLNALSENLWHKDKLNRLSTSQILLHYEKPQSCHNNDPCVNFLKLLLSVEEATISIDTSQKAENEISKMEMAISANRISEKNMPAVLYGLIGLLHTRFSRLWEPVLKCLSTLISQQFGLVWDKFVLCLEQCQLDFMKSRLQTDERETTSSSTPSDLVECFHGFVSPPSDNTPCKTVLFNLIKTLQKIPTLSESRTRQIVPLFLKFLGYNSIDVFSVGSFDSKVCKGREWQNVLGEWLDLLKLMRNSKSFFKDQYVKEVLMFRLLDGYDEDIQLKVLDCLLNWKDEFLVQYKENLKNLINSKSLRETLTTWSLSKDSTLIQENHRTDLISLVTRLLVPKVRKHKTSASRKKTNVHHRKAVLGFFAQLDVNELPLFFFLLVKPLLSTSELCSGIDEFDSAVLLNIFTTDNTMALSWKKKYGFLHVVEDILGVFDESRIKPYLDLLVGCIARILFGCTLTLESAKSIDSETNPSFKSEDDEKCDVASGTMATKTGTKQLRELRSFCLKIIAFILNKYDEHDFGCEFWSFFFNSVKPLIDNFKNEGATSEKPSSLFSCFLIMSKSYKLVPLLSKDNNLVPNIFAILSVTSASEAISNSVLKFIENLLILDAELDQEDNIVKRILLPNLNSLICGLHHLFKFNNVARRKLLKCPGVREINIFKLLSKYIKHPSEARQFVDIMLPMLAKGVQHSDACVEALNVIRHLITVLSGEGTSEILNAVSPLLISGGLNIRTIICDVLDVIAREDSSLMTATNFVRELNATSTSMDIDGLDYDRTISAYESINKDFFYTVKEKHALLVLSHAVHDMVSEEMILRQSGYGLLLSFIDFCAEIVDRQINLDSLGWSHECIEKIVNKFIFKHMGDAMNRESSVQKVWIDLLREMMLKIPKVNNLESFRDLWSKDAEQDFFSNVIHLQKHRRARALLRFNNFVSSGNSPKVLTTKVFLPLFLNMLYDEQDGKAENIRRACLETIATIAGDMEWKSYYAFLMRCFRQMTLKPDKQKVLLRLISSILGQFHFLSPCSGTSTSPPVLRPCTSSAEAVEIQGCLQNTVLPKIQKLLVSDSDKVNVNISLVTLKLLKFLPDDNMDLQLPSIIHRISNFLKNRLESSREEARAALAACLKELGVNYLQLVVRVLQATLKRGFELHVLGYTLHFILSKMIASHLDGNLDYCLQELLWIVENDIFGNVSEEKEVDKIASKMKETRKCRSFETLELIAQKITFKTHALILLSPVEKKIKLQTHMTTKDKSKVETMLGNIAAGIQKNPSVDLEVLLVFLYGLLEEKIYVENNTMITDKQETAIKPSRLIESSSQSSHLITVFALGMLHNCIKNVKLPKEDENLLARVDPFVRLLTECLNSKYEDVISAALKCLYVVVKLPLPSLKSEAEKIKTSLLYIAQGSVNASSPLVQSCLKLLTFILQKSISLLSKKELQMVIQFPPFIDLERNPSIVALSLLKEIVKQKLVVPEIYDLVTRIQDLMVTSQFETIRKKCGQILLQFLLGYKLAEKRMTQHIDKLLLNLRYEHSTGREAVLEMLHAVFKKFPKNVLDKYSYSIFIHLVVGLANDSDNKVRSMTGSALKRLIGHVGPHSLHSIVEYSLTWYGGEKQHLWGTSAQVLGLLVEEMQKEFGKSYEIFPVMRNIFHTALDALASRNFDPSTEGAIPFWKEAYHSLVLLEKLLHQFPDSCLTTDLEVITAGKDIWDTVCELLLHPHMWIREVSNRLLALYFASATKASNLNSEKLSTLPLTKPSRLFLISVTLCCQLKAMRTDTTASTVITQNLTFIILTLHSMLVANKDVDLNAFKSALKEREKVVFLKALDLLDSGKGSSMFASLISDDDYSNNLKQSSIVAFLLKRLGKIAIQMEIVQMNIIFNIFKTVSKKIINPENTSSENVEGYAYEMLVPLYKVCEGYAGKVVQDEVKQLAQEALETIKNILGSNNFVQIYCQIRNHLKKKREKRKREDKLLAVVNPIRNAKRKLRIASKNKANKKRRVMTMKMTRWNR